MSNRNDIYSEGSLSKSARTIGKRTPPSSKRKRVDFGRGSGRRGRRRSLRRDSIVIALTVALIVTAAYFYVLVSSFRDESRWGRTEQRLERPAPEPAREEPEEVEAPVQLDLFTAERIAQLRANVVLHRQALARAYDHLHADRWREAQERIDQAARLLPESTALLKAQAEVYLARKEYLKAIPLLLDVLEREPEDLGARVAMAGALIAGRQDEAALILTEWVLDSQPFTREARHLAAVANLNLGRFQAAILHLRKALEIDSTYRPAVTLLILAYRRRGEHEAVIRLCREQLALGAQDSTLYFNLAVSHALLDEPGHAVEWLRQARDLFGLSYVRTWLQSGDFESVRETLVFRELFEQLDALEN